MSTGLYGLDETSQELLKVENFEKDFSPKEFIETLSKNHAGIGALSEALDPKPYIRTFEAALGELQRIQEYTKKREEEASKEVQDAQLNHSKNVATLGRTIEGAMSEFGVLDGLIGDIGAATSTLSDKLERLSLQHEMASSSGFLIECYLSFANKGNCPELERFWQGPVIARRRCANVIRQLQTLAKRLEGVEANSKAQAEIDKFAEMLENDLLNLFNDAYARADLTAMKESADILTDFNGGSSVVQSFVNQHDFFIEVNRMVSSEETNSTVWTAIADVDSKGQEFDSMQQEDMDDISNVISTELEIIRRVFRDPAAVLRVFLQRVFAQRIEGRLEGHLLAAENVSMLAYVRTLHISYGKVSTLVKSLKETLNQSEIDGDGELASLLDQNFADMFVIYVENGKYFERERKSLVECIESITARFTEAHSQRKLVREQSLLGRFTSSLDTKEDKTKDGRIGQLMGLMRSEKNNAPKRPSGSHEVVEYDSGDVEIQYAHVQKALRMAAESMNRDLELVPPAEVYKDADQLLTVILTYLGEKYIDTALEDAVASSQDSKTEDLSYLKVASKASDVTQLVATFVKTVLLSMVNGSSSVQKEMITRLNGYVQGTEKKINVILHNTIDLVNAKLSSMLAQQKKKDYMPREESTRMEQTEVSIEIGHFLDNLFEVAQESLDGANVNTFLIEIGVGFRDLLLEHLKKHTVSAAGANTLMGDLQHYQSKIDAWSISELTDSYAILHSVGNLFVAQPQAIMSLLRQSNLSQIKPYAIREYLSKRVDYYSNAINKILLGTQPTRAPASSNGQSLSSNTQNNAASTGQLGSLATMRYPMVPHVI